eukprot:5841045-Pleurochrysis_carterae.AAC.1
MNGLMEGAGATLTSSIRFLCFPREVRARAYALQLGARPRGKPERASQTRANLTSPAQTESENVSWEESLDASGPLYFSTPQNARVHL